MSDVTTTVDTYLAMWNEDAPGRREQLIEYADMCESPRAASRQDQAHRCTGKAASECRRGVEPRRVDQMGRSRLQQIGPRA